MKVKCPTCHKKTEWEGNPFRPFCSERCKTKDLGGWASEEFKIEGERVEKDEEKKPTLH
ncbi:MAG: DNA gyrase inhibitor YacG [Deltaproteobacteria bacterium]|nr:DNA gyrase inhibitor YacG [Deltaproteobacteria bacterium]